MVSTLNSLEYHSMMLFCIKFIIFSSQDSLSFGLQCLTGNLQRKNSCLSQNTTNWELRTSALTSISFQDGSDML